jgi:aspartyl-tRNA(Asn)/glutamyl-tRNA(Gln) amidotransferase subunit C
MISMEDIEQIADLAKLRLMESEKKDFLIELSRMIEYVDQIKEVNTQGVESTYQVLTLKNNFRKDKVQPSMNSYKVFMNAQNVEDGYFRVPKVLD